MSGWEQHLTTFKNLTDIVQTIGIIIIGIYTFSLRHGIANKKSIEELEIELVAAKSRMVALENRLESAPTHQDLGNLHDRINDLSGAVRELVGVMSGVQRSLDRVEDKLMNEGGKR